VNASLRQPDDFASSRPRRAGASSAGASFVKGGLAGWQVRRLHVLAGGDLRALTAARLAEEARLSPFYFTRAFGSAMGTTPGRWLTRARVERARDLLHDPALSVSEIARQVGYRGAPQLTRAFRAHFGTSPSAFREENQAERPEWPRAGAR